MKLVGILPVLASFVATASAGGVKGSGRMLQREEGDTLFFAVTFRDFLPCRCLIDADGGGFDGSQIVEAAYDDNDVSNAGNNGQIRCGLLVGDAQWLANFRSGEISGHPDFEAAGVVDGVAHCAPEVDPNNPVENPVNLLPIGSCKNVQSEVADNTNQPIILERLELDTPSGVPKPIYCSDGINDSCGTGNNGGRASSTKEFFDMWFNDDPKFNKRVGQRLGFDNANGNTFIFNQNSNEAPDFGNDRQSGFFGPLSRFKTNDGTGFFINRNDFDNNPRDAEAWPVVFNGDRGFYYTTELHTTFEFRNGPNDVMEFLFSGDDDFWAFIDGKLVIDLQGLHARDIAQIDLLANDDNGVQFAQQLGLVNGEVYTLDIYHAERQFSQSNFDVTTSLFAACNVLQSGTKTVDFTNAASIQKADFATNGVDLEDGDTSFLLTKTGRTFQASSIFTQQVQNLEPGFIASFRVNSNGIPDGFAFVIQAEGVEDLPTSTQNFNFGGLTNSLAVVFDFCIDRNEVNPTCVDKEVRLHFPLNRAQANNAERNGNTQRKVEKFFNRDFERSADREIEVEIIYFGGRPDFLEVYIENSLYLRQSGFNIPSVLGNGGGHVGFTATTSLVSSDIEISDFVLETVLEETGNTRAEFDVNDFELQQILANGNFESEGFKFQTVDFCENDINTGGLADDFTAVFTEIVDESGDGRILQETVEGTVIDNGDGSYNVILNTEIVGNFSMEVTFGDFNIVVDRAYEVFALEDADKLNNNVDEGANPLPFVFGGIAIFVLCGLFTFLFVKFRNDWNKNKRYIKDGAEFKRDMNTTFAGQDEYSVAGKKLLKTQMEINAMKAKGVEDDREDEISKLEKENSDMLEVLRTDKELEALQNVAVPGDKTDEAFKSKKKKKYKKLDFTI